MANHDELIVTWRDVERDVTRKAKLTQASPGLAPEKVVPQIHEWAEQIAREGFWIGPAMFIPAQFVLVVQLPDRLPRNI